MKITGIVVTKNEELNIKDCLESMKWLDEIIIVDTNSEDKTLAIAENYTDRIYSTEIENIPERRKYSLTHLSISNKWILFLDADERITPELRDEILSLSEDSGTCGYYINRRNYYFGKWIKHCGIYPDYCLRLFRKDKGHVTDRIIHEGIVVDGKCEKLKNDMLHYSYRDMEHMVNKINFFSTAEAEENFTKNKKISRSGVFTHFISAFLRVFISRRGYKDKIHGFYVSFSYAMVNFLSHLKLLKLQNKL
jgi:glycosyltransferase involved in cell wall biosynthesis